MDLEQLKKLVQLMDDSNLSELSLKDKSTEVTLKRGGYASLPAAQLPLPVPLNPASVLPGPGEADPAPAASNASFIIKSPMVGTFYAAPTPDAAPYVTAGTAVKPDTVVCVLEAMKVMNEICAECSGKIVEVLVKNGAAIEYGQPLFKVELNA